MVDMPSHMQRDFRGGMSVDQLMAAVKAKEAAANKNNPILAADQAAKNSIAPNPVIKDAAVVEVPALSKHARKYRRVTPASGFSPTPPRPRPVFRLTAKRFLLAAEKSGDNKRAMSALINGVIKPRILDNYANQRAADQYDWEPMKRSTRVRRIADYFPPEPLMDRGRGIAGLRLQTVRPTNFVSTKDMVAFKGFPGTMYQHGYYHHFGYTSKSSGKVPRRAAVVLDSRKDPEKVERIVAAVIEGRLEGLGF